MSWGAVAGLIAAAAAVVFVALCAVPLLKLGGVMDELRMVVRRAGEGTTPILDELKGTVTTTNEEIARLAQVTEELTRMSQNASQMTQQAADISTVVATPLVRTAEVAGRAASAARDVGRRVNQRRSQRHEEQGPVLPPSTTTAAPVRDGADETPAARRPATGPAADTATTDAVEVPTTPSAPAVPATPSAGAVEEDVVVEEQVDEH